MIQRHEGIHALLTVGGIGHMRPASGTWGSLPPVALAAVLAAAGFGPGTWVWHVVLLAVVIAFGLGCALLGDEGEAWWGKDPSPVVADEVAGMALTLALIPMAPGWIGWWLIGAFLLFRLADIIKPWPADGFQSIPGGWGIMLDDLAAAVHAAVPLIILAFVLA